METNSRNKNPITTKNLEDLIFNEVLPRTPTKSLLRFKTVARHWNAFITSVEFVKTHVRHQSSVKSMSVLTVDTYESFHLLDYAEGIEDMKTLFGKKQSTLFDCLLSLSKCLASILLPCVNLEGPIILDIDLEADDFLSGYQGISMQKIGKFESDSIEVLSSCNGLLFMVSISYDVDSHCRSGFDYVVYNPVLGPDHFVKIPHPDEYRLGLGGPHPSLTYAFGFAYVSSTDDYYIVFINLPGDLNVTMGVYPLKSKEWRYDELTLRPTRRSWKLEFQNCWDGNTGTLIKGILYWGMSQGRRPEFIFAYDLSTPNNPTHSLLPYPTRFGQTIVGVLKGLGLCCLDGCLCAWSQDGRDVVEMWMMKEHLDWNKLFRIQMEFPVRDFFGLNKMEQVLAYSDYNKLHLIDLISHTPVTVLHKAWNAVSYIPSLEALMDSEPNDEE